MNKFNFLNPIFIITIISFFIIVIFSLIFLHPSLQEMVVARENITNKRQILTEREGHFLSLKEYKQKIEAHQEELDKISSALPEDAQLNLFSLLRFFEKTSDKTGVILTEIGIFTITSLEKRPEIKETKLNFKIKGTYAAFRNFLIELERSARIIKVEEISFSSPEKGNLFTFNIGIRVHSY